MNKKFSLLITFLLFHLNIKPEESLEKKIEHYKRFVANKEKTQSEKPYIIEAFDKFKVVFPTIHNQGYNRLWFLYRDIFIYEEYKPISKISDEPFIIDCGCNVGMATLYFKSIYPNSKILAFEPSHSNFVFANTNITMNKLENVKLEKKALSNKKGKTNLYLPGAGSSSTIIERSNQVETVETTLLSEYINKTVDLIKIDVEGAETEILEDLSSNDKLKLVKEIIMEFHHTPNNNSKNNLAKMLNILESNNFNYIIGTPQQSTHIYNKNVAANNYQTLMITAFKNEFIK